MGQIERIFTNLSVLIRSIRLIRVKECLDSYVF